MLPNPLKTFFAISEPKIPTVVCLCHMLPFRWCCLFEGTPEK